MEQRGVGTRALSRRHYGNLVVNATPVGESVRAARSQLQMLVGTVLAWKTIAPVQQTTQ